MPSERSQTIVSEVLDAGLLYHRLVLVIGPAGSGKTVILKMLEEKLMARLINVNLTLSEKLLHIPPVKRPLMVSRVLGQVVSIQESQTILLDNNEMLFHPDLMVDPLQLFRQLSRNRTIVASWTGSIDDGDLVYAALGWPEYRRYPAADIVTVCVQEVGELNEIR